MIRQKAAAEPRRNICASAGSRELLSARERVSLERCERRISVGLRTFLEVGQALLMVRDQRLYREEYDSFEHYCRARWHMTRGHAYRLMSAAGVARGMSPMGDIPLPSSERHIRALSRLPIDLAAAAWKKAVESAEGKPVSMAHVQNAIAWVTITVLPGPSASSKAKEEPPLLKHLLARQIERVRDHLRHNAMDRILEVIEHMKLLIEHYAVPTDEHENQGSDGVDEAEQR